MTQRGRFPLRQSLCVTLVGFEPIGDCYAVGFTNGNDGGGPGGPGGRPW